MKTPVDHIARPTLPWRNDAPITECGFDATKVTTLTREDYFVRLKDFGQQRSAMVTCMTCAQTAARWGTWETDPRKALEREIQWEQPWRNADRGERLRDELLSIAALIDAHREEFDAHVAASGQRRDWLAKKAANAATKQQNRPRGSL